MSHTPYSFPMLQMLQLLHSPCLFHRAMTERRNTQNSMKNWNYCDCNRKNAIKFGGFKKKLYLCSMKKPSDFWLRKGKVVGETKPTEKSREEPKKSTIRTLLFYSIIYAVYRTWFIYHLSSIPQAQVHLSSINFKSTIYNLKSKIRPSAVKYGASRKRFIYHQ